MCQNSSRNLWGGGGWIVEEGSLIYLNGIITKVGRQKGTENAAETIYCMSCFKGTLTSALLSILLNSLCLHLSTTKGSQTKHNWAFGRSFPQMRK